MLADLHTYLPCDLLAKVDITSMAHGLECRSPFLDHRVVERAAAIPFHRLVRGTSPKPVLTETMPELFPEELVSRRKMGFSVPVSHWIRGDLGKAVRDVLLEKRTHERGYFRPASVERLLDEHDRGTWDHGHKIWSLLCLEFWHRTFIDPPTPPGRP